MMNKRYKTLADAQANRNPILPGQSGYRKAPYEERIVKLIPPEKKSTKILEGRIPIRKIVTPESVFRNHGGLER